MTRSVPQGSVGELLFARDGIFASLDGLDELDTARRAIFGFSLAEEATTGFLHRARAARALINCMPKCVPTHHQTRRAIELAAR